MTSDHRVEGSSPSGCRSATRANLQTIYSLKIDVGKTITYQSLATFDTIPLNFSRLIPIYTHTSHVAAEAKINAATLQSGPNRIRIVVAAMFSFELNSLARGNLLDGAAAWVLGQVQRAEC